MTTGQIEVAFAGDAVVGEGPCWHQGSLVWVDLFSGVLFVGDTRDGTVTSVDLGGTLGAAVPRREGGYALLTQDGYALLTDAQVTPADDVVADPAIRMNDGKCDTRGRFWAGSCAYAQDVPVGSLFVWEPGTAARTVDTGFVLPNGLGWSPDDATFYLVDTMDRCLYGYDFDIAQGAVQNRRTLCHFDAADGLADGLAVDAEGVIWIAFFGGKQLMRVAPDGRIVERLPMPVSKPTSCAFGDGTELYVTSARLDLSAEQLDGEPLAGSVLVLDAGVQGTPVGISL